MWVDALCKWFLVNQRELPWRRDNDPYHVWLSEIMLQQTQVATTIAYYNRFLEAFPTVKALAEASEDDVLKLWQGLGYYTRARNLKRCADVVWQQYDGKFPNTFTALLKLPGIGPYTAGAIASIAFGRRVPAVDGNVLRVIARHFALSDDIAEAKTTKQFHDLLLPLIPEHPGIFNQALMELGATVCTPQSPMCDQCPIMDTCKAYETLSVMQYPVKKKRVKQKKISIGMGIVRCKKAVLFFKQVEGRLLNGLWSLPFAADAGSVSDLRKQLVEDFQLTLDKGYLAGEVKHVFTHLIWDIHVYVFEAAEAHCIDFPEVCWCSEDAFDTLALPTVVKKALKQGGLMVD
jgi:A/G-specific adenine glycosylase